MSDLQPELRFYLPAIVLDRHFARPVRYYLLRTLLTLEIIIPLVIVAYFVGERFLPGVVTSLPVDVDVFIGIFFILLGPFLGIMMLSFFYNTRYFRGIVAITGEGTRRDRGISYEVARVLTLSKDDITLGFLSTTYGRYCMSRCGISSGQVNDYFETQRSVVTDTAIEFPPEGIFTLEHLANYILEQDKSFREFLFSHGVTDDVHKGAVAWTMRSFHESKYVERWWSRDNLGKVNGIGKEFSYGIAYELRKYMRNIKTTAVFSTLLNDTAYADEKIAQIEQILTRAKGSNPLVVGEPGIGKMDILVRLGKKMQDGKSMASLSGKRLVVLDTKAFFVMNNSKQEFESTFQKLLVQTARAGNIIIVIENISAFIHNIESLGVDAVEALDQFLASPALHIIATTDPVELHQNLEKKPRLMQRFESVHIEKPDLSSSIRVLEDVAVTYEKRFDILFTYPAILAVAEGAQQYVTEGVMPDKAVSLLAELAPVIAVDSGSLVSREEVEKFISEKTGIPTGPVSLEERDKLMHLEDELHKYVVGQDSAITAISNAMRRSRAGIQAKDKPMGTFLFLGSTGVGKTETAKALAKTIFGDESKLLRLDMSEYQGSGGLGRLMGEGDNVGILPNMLREHPYGVLLLDEFEKTSPDIHDLFLQILDEGVFTDSRGTRVNARNIIMIATSNAGSDLVWDMSAKGIDPSEHRDEIIDAIVHGGIYKPELINRFDGVVIFEPLSAESQKNIARIMLEELKERIKQKGFELVIDDSLVTYVSKEGYSKQFGARPMRRAIQDTVEEKIAEKIIAGALRPGSTIQFTEEDFTAK